MNKQITLEERLIKKFKNKNLLEWSSLGHSYQSREQSMVEWLSTAFSKIRADERKKIVEWVKKTLKLQIMIDEKVYKNVIDRQKLLDFLLDQDKTTEK